jgi:hypothetical protein
MILDALTPSYCPLQKFVAGETPLTYSVPTVSVVVLDVPSGPTHRTPTRGRTETLFRKGF